MWHTYYAPATVSEALDLLARYGDACRVICGRHRPDPRARARGAPPGGAGGHFADPGTGADHVRVGRRACSPSARNVTHNQVVATRMRSQHAFPLARACWLVGAPQIRNRGTVAGNLITASPANDTITPLWAMDATVTLVSAARGERTLPFNEFFLGVRRTAIQPDELLVRINVPTLKPTRAGHVPQAGPAAGAGDQPDQRCGRARLRRRGTVSRARIALGAVAPTIVRASEAEAYLAGKTLTEDVIERGRGLTAAAARPDLRYPGGRRLPPRHGARVHGRVRCASCAMAPSGRAGPRSRCCCGAATARRNGNGTSASARVRRASA